MIVVFAKTGGDEILRVVPRSVKGEMDQLKGEMEGRDEGQGDVGLVSAAAAVGLTASAKETTAEISSDAKKDEQSPTATEKVPKTEEYDLMPNHHRSIHATVVPAGILCFGPHTVPVPTIVPHFWFPLYPIGPIVPKQ